MAIPAPSINFDPNPHPALSYAGLRAEALELLGRLCGDQWSDFNSHDPGITILEQLCFALTELAYRINFPIEDLLASAGPDWQPAPADILVGDPVTEADLIALLRSLGAEVALVQTLDQPALPLYFRARPGGRGDLDLERGLARFDQTSVIPKGVLRLSVQQGSSQPGTNQPSSNQPDDGASFLLQIASHVHGSRLLGRDFELALHQPFQVFVQASLEVEPAGSTDQLLAAIHNCLNRVIGAAASSARGSARSPGLRCADLIKELKGLPEVRQVCSLRLAKDAAGPFQPWYLPLPEAGGACLAANPQIELLHRGLPLECQSTSNVKEVAVSSATATGPAAAGASIPSAPVAKGRQRQLISQVSLARQLPAVYGVGLAGLPAGASGERRSQVQQLRAYLLFFDQLLANSQAQLALAPKLLSPVAADDPHPLDTYAVLLADDPELDLAGLRRVGGDSPETWLRQALHSAPVGGANTNRPALLAHLLSRFGEQLGIYQQLPGPAKADAKALVADRSAFLRRIAPLSGGRGSGPNLLPLDAALASEPALVGEAAQGAFAERLRRKLGLPLGADGSPALLVIEHLLLRPIAEDSAQRVQADEDPIPFLSDVARPDPWSHRVSVVINEGLVIDAKPLSDYTAPTKNSAVAPFELLVARTLREELPAHLAAELHWFSDQPSESGQGQDDWSQLLQAWAGFRSLLACYRRATLGGGSPDQPLLALRLRDSRDRLISMLELGLPWPLRDIPLTNQLMVATNQPAVIKLPFSQKGVRYQLIKADSGERISATTGKWVAPECSMGSSTDIPNTYRYADGNGGELELTTPPITANLILRVQASVLHLPGSLAIATPGVNAPVVSIATADNGRQVTTLLAGTIEVVEGVDPNLNLKLLQADLLTVDWLAANLSVANLPAADLPAAVQITDDQLINNQSDELPRLSSEADARLASYGQKIRVLVEASQPGVRYELIDNSERAKKFEDHTLLSEAVIGNSGAIVLEAKFTAAEDRDLAVRASLQKFGKKTAKQATNHTAAISDKQVLTKILPLRVRANPDLSVLFSSPVVDLKATASLQIGASESEGAGSQKSVEYLLRSRPLVDADWLFNVPNAPDDSTDINDHWANPRGAIELLDGERSIRLRHPDTDIDTGSGLTDFQPAAQSVLGTGAMASIPLNGVADNLLVVVQGRKSHRLNPFCSDDGREATSLVTLQQAAAVLVRPDAQVQLILRRELEGTCVWSLLGGQPGVAYTLSQALANGTVEQLAVPLPVHQRPDAPGGIRGIERLRLEVDLVVAAADSGPPRAEFSADPANLEGLQVGARLLLSGVETTMALAPIRVLVQPAAVGRGESVQVLVKGLQPGRQGSIFQGEQQLDQGSANDQGQLLLTSGALAGATSLQLELAPSPATATAPLRPALSCPLAIAQGVNTDLPLRLLNFNPLQADAPAHLMDWGATAEVELLDTQKDVKYGLIAVVDRDRPLAEQTLLSPQLLGTGGRLMLVYTKATEDVDLLVRGTRRLDDQGVQIATGYLNGILPLRVRANPDLSITAAQAVLEPAEPSILLVGDTITPSQSSVTYKAWSKSFTLDDLLFADDLPQATSPQAATPQVSTLPPVLDGERWLPPADRLLRAPVSPAPADPAAAGWIGRGQPKKGTDGQQKGGGDGQLRLSLGQARADAYLMVIGSKQHSLGPVGSDLAKASAASQVLMRQLVSQLTRPDPGQRLALVADCAGIDTPQFGSAASRWLLLGGEPGCFYSFLGSGSSGDGGGSGDGGSGGGGSGGGDSGGGDSGGSGGDGHPLALPVYVHRQTPENPPATRGIGWLRLELDLALAGSDGSALETNATLADLRAAAVRVSWAHTGTSAHLRRGPLWVAVAPTVAPTPGAAAGFATVRVWGLSPNEQAQLMLRNTELTAPQAGGQDPANPVELEPGPLAETTILDLVISSADATGNWKIPVTIPVI